MTTTDIKKMIRSWGSWEVLDNTLGGTTKVKKLIVDPGCELSYQRHFEREELWYVHTGLGSVILNETDDANPRENKPVTLKSGTILRIPIKVWHQLFNVGTDPLVIIEIQFGKNCIEEDIIRLSS